MASTPSTPPALLWFIRDLRLADNPALQAAVAGGRPVLPVFILDEHDGAAAKWWLHGSLTALAADLAARGARLILRRGEPAEIIPALAEQIGAAEVHAGSPPEPSARAALDAVEKLLGGRLHRHRSEMLFDYGAIRTRTGGVFTVFTPFANACRAAGIAGARQTPPSHIAAPGVAPASDSLADWNLLPTKPDWAGGMRAHWTPGEAGAEKKLRKFLHDAVDTYDHGRDRPAIDGSSSLSPHLHWGEIAPVTVWQAAGRADNAGGRVYRNELLWREFCANLLWHHPDLATRPLHAEFADMRWREDPTNLAAWQRGHTGIPMVDAGMRQLWQLGWMHNRVRMITASFLIKHLLIDWRIGEEWFWDALVDADLASNAANWQWVAGCGADASPFFRVFNPVLQGRKFDPEGAYVRHFVPELARLPDRWIHSPWEAPEDVLDAAGVTLGKTYPLPVVDLAVGRERALAAFRALRAA